MANEVALGTAIPMDVFEAARAKKTEESSMWKAFDALPINQPTIVVGATRGLRISAAGWSHRHKGYNIMVATLPDGRYAALKTWISES